MFDGVGRNASSVLPYKVMKLESIDLTEKKKLGKIINIQTVH